MITREDFSTQNYQAYVKSLLAEHDEEAFFDFFRNELTHAPSKQALLQFLNVFISACGTHITTTWPRQFYTELTIAAEVRQDLNAPIYTYYFILLEAYKVFSPTLNEQVRSKDFLMGFTMDLFQYGLAIGDNTLMLQLSRELLQQEKLVAYFDLLNKVRCQLPIEFDKSSKKAMVFYIDLIRQSITLYFNKVLPYFSGTNESDDVFLKSLDKALDAVSYRIEAEKIDCRFFFGLLYEVLYSCDDRDASDIFRTLYLLKPNAVLQCLLLDKEHITNERYLRFVHDITLSRLMHPEDRLLLGYLGGDARNEFPIKVSSHIVGEWFTEKTTQNDALYNFIKGYHVFYGTQDIEPDGQRAFQLISQAYEQARTSKQSRLQEEISRFIIRLFTQQFEFIPSHYDFFTTSQEVEHPFETHEEIQSAFGIYLDRATQPLDVYYYAAEFLHAQYKPFEALEKLSTLLNKKSLEPVFYNAVESLKEKIIIALHRLIDTDERYRIPVILKFSQLQLLDYRMDTSLYQDLLSRLVTEFSEDEILQCQLANKYTFEGLVKLRLDHPPYAHVIALARSMLRVLSVNRRTGLLKDPREFSLREFNHLIGFLNKALLKGEYLVDIYKLLSDMYFVLEGPHSVQAQAAEEKIRTLCLDFSITSDAMLPIPATA